jgi:hypothetical protein
MPSAAGTHNTLAIEEGLVPTIPTLGGINSPPVPPGSNDPGLNPLVSSKSLTDAFGGSMTKKHWLIVAAVLLLLVGLWYFGVFSGGATSAA